MSKQQEPEPALSALELIFGMADLEYHHLVDDQPPPKPEPQPPGE